MLQRLITILLGACMAVAWAGGPSRAAAQQLEQCTSAPIPEGWITVARRWRAVGCGDGSPGAPNARVIQRHVGAEPGRQLLVCADAPTPPGWVELRRLWRATSGCLRGDSPSRPNLKLIRKLDAREEGCVPRVEREDRGLRLRPHVDAFTRCFISEPVYGQLMNDWFEVHPADSPPAWIALGRAVNYPWLSAAIVSAAAGHPDWDMDRGRARDGKPNALVARILMGPRLRERLQRPLTRAGLRLISVSVEKVLVAPLAERAPESAAARGRHGAARVPFDAQIWLQVE